MIPRMTRADGTIACAKLRDAVLTVQKVMEMASVIRNETKMK